jgi:hypothetical protein
VITVLCPSRHRPELLKRSVESLHKHASFALQSQPYEIRVATDADDPNTAHIALDLDCHPFRCHHWGYPHLENYFNAMCKNLSPGWTMLWNDDAVMNTYGWNTKLDALLPRIIVGEPHTTLSPGLNTFPCVRTQVIEMLGGYCTAPTPHVDSWWQDIGRALDACAPVDINITHDRFDITGNNRDETFLQSNASKRNAEYFSPIIQSQLHGAVAKLRDGLQWSPHS